MFAVYFICWFLISLYSSFISSDKVTFNSSNCIKFFISSNKIFSDSIVQIIGENVSKYLEECYVKEITTNEHVNVGEPKRKKRRGQKRKNFKCF